ncbi:hypothetical protein BJ742DRAFT_869436 [Cladochytrium replicatum]|nr:hypothetical protein BJ742DRAFT_869436 [Cladochytrium replicatum]
MCLSELALSIVVTRLTRAIWTCLRRRKVAALKASLATPMLSDVVSLIHGVYAARAYDFQILNGLFQAYGSRSASPDGSEEENDPVPTGEVGTGNIIYNEVHQSSRSPQQIGIATAEAGPEQTIPDSSLNRESTIQGNVSSSLSELNIDKRDIPGTGQPAIVMWRQTEYCSAELDLKPIPDTADAVCSFAALPHYIGPLLLPLTHLSICEFSSRCRKWWIPDHYDKRHDKLVQHTLAYLR